MKAELEFLTDGEIYRRVLREEVPSARRSLFIASALVKQTRLEAVRGVVPFCELARDLVERGVALTFLVSGCPSRPFMETLVSFPAVLTGAVWRICPRNHMKVVLIDGDRLYVGSANLTGAGLGMKGRAKRNFEIGFFTRDPALIRGISGHANSILEGRHCDACGTKNLCRREHEKFENTLRETARPDRGARK